ncbi:hypothetical protein VN97_g9095 [Penicillium thymicola]|uniref:Large ribosomal subunit protein mL59 domain-containing protein n=1 Tax=Penicillium thymicola TaxID=293382 RepID=A0AAI9X573_PENTH|nr:hypothetical protein VN97_g9095 [Penicillium thymicola]
MSVSKQTSALLENIPQRLVNFFARYPPQVHSAAVRRPAPANGEGYVPTKVESPYTPDRDAKGAPGEKKHGWTPSRALLVTSEELRNPFLPHKRFGKWEAPKYGLRQQADLMKLAIKYNVGTLLPPSRKSPEFKETRRAERGLQVKGTGVGHKVKGHKWERTMESRLEDRRKAMEGMPEMVRMWKQVSIRLVLPVEVVRAMLTRRNREVMAVAGDNGPSGNGDAPSPHITASCFSLFWPVCSFWFFNVLLIPMRTGSAQILVRAIIAGAWDGVLSLKYTINPICTIQSTVTSPNGAQENHLHVYGRCYLSLSSTSIRYLLAPS